MSAGEHPTVEIYVRPLTSDDRPACEQFECGDDPHGQQVARFLRELYWGGRPRGEETIAAFVVGTDELYGFGCWKHTTTQLGGSGDNAKVIRIAYFGVRQPFWGARTPDGAGTADVLYATVEARARQHEESTASMPVELFCVEDNLRGRAFWARQGFEDIGTVPYEKVKYVKMLRQPAAG